MTTAPISFDEGHPQKLVSVGLVGSFREELLHAMTPPSEPGDFVKYAKAMAYSAHEGQFRRDGTTPYICHPEAVAARVAGDPIAEAVAWLHDVLEDTAISEQVLRDSHIPEEVVSIIVLLTKKEGMRYEDYLLAIRANPTAKKVKIADMLANLADNPSEAQIIKYAKGLLICLTAN